MTQLNFVECINPKTNKIFHLLLLRPLLLLIRWPTFSILLLFSRGIKRCGSVSYQPNCRFNARKLNAIIRICEIRMLKLRWASWLNRRTWHVQTKTLLGWFKWSFVIIAHRHTVARPSVSISMHRNVLAAHAVYRLLVYLFALLWRIAHVHLMLVMNRNRTIIKLRNG